MATENHSSTRHPFPNHRLSGFASYGDPEQGLKMFQMRPGVPAQEAWQFASLAIGSIRDLLDRGITDGLSAEECFAFHHLACAAKGVVDAMEPPFDDSRGNAPPRLEPNAIG